MTFLAERRQELGLTQQQVADYVGVKQSAVAYWESGKRMPSVQRLVPLSCLLQCSVDELVERPTNYTIAQDGR